MTAATFPQLLAEQLRRSGARPLVTFYDDATGERVELSVVTYANWVAKTAGVLQDEVGVEHGDTVLVDLPTHWLAPVWLGACWSVGAAVTTDRAADSALVVCGPDGLERYAAGDRPVVALSLAPMGRRFTDPLPAGVVDFGVVVWGQPDSFAAYDEPDAANLAWRGRSSLTQAQVLADSLGGRWASPGTRLLTDVPPVSDEGIGAFVGPLGAGGGTVWVTSADPGAWDHRAATEQVTETFRSPGQPA